MSDVTRLLLQLKTGEKLTAENLLPLVYDELRSLAAAKLAQEKSGQTLQATALVHEVFLRLVDSDTAQRFNNRQHFFAIAAEAMRRILVDNARRRSAQKRGGEYRRQDLPEHHIGTAAPSDEVLAVHEALEALAQKDPLAAELVKFHYFAGFTLDESADLLGMSRATAYRMWKYARTWLRAHLLAE